MAILTVVFIVSLFSVCVGAADGFSYTLSSDGKSYILSSYNKNEAEVQIASAYNGLPVTKIAAGAFSGNISTYKIIIPSSIKSIESGAFSAMPSLYEFEASGSYTSVDGVLYSSDKKTLIRYPEARTDDCIVISTVKTIGEYAFAGCRVKRVDISNVTSVLQYAFYASDVENIVFSSSLSSIGAHAFEKSAIKKIQITGQASVSSYAFAYCEDLVYADISGSTLNGEGAFYSDTSLLAVSMPKNQTDLPSLTFAGCTSLVTAPVGKSVKTIGSKAFYGCVSLLYASCGTASYASDSFGLCDKITPDKNAYVSLGQKSVDVTLKVKESYTPAIISGYDLFTSSHIVNIESGVITALFEGEAEVYAVSRRGGDCTVINITVSDGGAVIESTHPYRNGTFNYSYTVSGSPEKIAVTFSTSDMLKQADYIKIQDKKGNVYGTYYGSALAGKTLFIDGDTVKISLVSISGGAYGFRIVSAVPVSSLHAVSGISIPKDFEMTAGEKTELEPLISPSDAFPAELIYISEDKNIAYVTSDGVLYAIKEGVVKIKVYSAFYGAKTEFTVTVNEPETELFEYEIKNSRAYITEYNGPGGVCRIPDTLGGCSVVGINDKALSYKGITELYLSRTLSAISVNALEGNPALSGIYAPDNNTKLKTVNGVLYTKDGKMLVKVPNTVNGTFTVPDDVETVSDGAFSYCYGVTRVVLGKSVSDITGKAFINCPKIQIITSDSTKFTVVDGVLYTADKKTLVYFPAAADKSDYTVISGTKKIGAYAFNSAVKLKKLTISSSVTEIDGTALCETLYLNEISAANNTVYTVSDGTIYENGKIKFVLKNKTGVYTVKSGVKEILPYAFYNCCHITDIVFTSGLTDIGEYGFGYCTALDRVFLPVSLKNLGHDAFCGDIKLSVFIPDGVQISYLSDCSVLCGKNSSAYEYCTNNGIPYEFMYRSEYGAYKIYSKVKADLRVTENTDPVYISKFSAAAGKTVKAYDVYMVSGGVNLPAGEYILNAGSSENGYYYNNGELIKISADETGGYKSKREYVIQPYGADLVNMLTVRTLPDKTEYGVYDEFDPSGLTLYYTDSHGITSVIESGFDVVCDTGTAGKKTATVSYGGASAAFTVNVSKNALTGTVSISGKVRYGVTVQADVSAVKPSGAVLTYQWYSDGVKINGATGKTYTITKNDIGKNLTVKISSSSGTEGTLESAPVTVGKAEAAAPPKPVIKSYEANKVTLEAVSGCEYKLSSDASFKSSNVFEGLTPGVAYVFCQRYKETDTTEASDVSSTSYEIPFTYKIASDMYFVNDANKEISLVAPQTSVKTFLSGFKDSKYLTVIKDEKELSNTDIVGTGCEVRLSANGKIYDSCSVVITGDVNGDGKITITDYLKIKERILKGTALSKEKEYASDVNGDGKVTITDYLRLKYCIQNSVIPEQNRY